MKITKEEPITEKVIIDLLSRTSTGSRGIFSLGLMTVQISIATDSEKAPILKICKWKDSGTKIILENGLKLGALTLLGRFQRYAKPVLNQQNWLK